MSMRYKVNNKITSSEVCNMTPKEEDMEAVEYTESVEDIEAEEGVEEHLAEVEGRSSAITVASKVTSDGIVQ
jgi:hypothetical protein